MGDFSCIGKFSVYYTKLTMVTKLSLEWTSFFLEPNALWVIWSQVYENCKQHHSVCQCSFVSSKDINTSFYSCDMDEKCRITLRITVIPRNYLFWNVTYYDYYIFMFLSDISNVQFVNKLFHKRFILYTRHVFFSI